MNRIRLFFFMLLIFISCTNNSNDKNGNTTPKKQDINMSSILGKWKITDANPILEGTLISEYFENNTFTQNGTITSFQPSYVCQAASNGTYSISNNILTYSYLVENFYDCKPQEYQLLMDTHMGNKELETSQNKIILLDKKTMIQENIETKKQFTFIRIVE